jgi:hypothetical protein
MDRGTDPECSGGGGHPSAIPDLAQPGDELTRLAERCDSRFGRAIKGVTGREASMDRR